MLGQVDHKRQVRQGILIDGALRVVDEKAGNEDGEGEDADIMVRVLIECAQALSVEDEDVDGLSLRRGSLDGLAPDPDSLFR